MEKVIYQKHPSYLVNELYKKVIRADASRQALVGRDLIGA
jgi:hypothetical protein